MEGGRGSRGALASGSASRGQTPNAGPTNRRAKRKPKVNAAAPRLQGPIPQPYLALAPSPLTSVPSTSPAGQPSRLYSNTEASSSQLVLPSTYVRKSQSASPKPAASPQRPPLEGTSRRHAAGLLSPPAIVPGGQPAPPRPMLQSDAPASGRRRSAERLAGSPAGRRRSEEALRNVAMANQSMVSLGQLGQIMESDGPEPAPQSSRRRRRVVRDDGALARQPTVTSREEGRALGLARGASMRRMNVWDDLPEGGEPPPPFPFPTSSSSRNPPQFSPTEAAENQTTSTERPRSPPPSFEQATGLAPLLLPVQPIPEEEEGEPPDPPVEAPQTTTPPAVIVNEEQVEGAHLPSSPETHYASAPTSPIRSELSLDDEEEEASSEEREDRRMWNADLLAGYSLEDRVLREIVRRRTRGDVLEGLEPSPPTALPSVAVTPREHEAEASIGETLQTIEPSPPIPEPVETLALEGPRGAQDLEPGDTLPDSRSAPKEELTSVVAEHGEAHPSTSAQQNGTGEIKLDSLQVMADIPTGSDDPVEGSASQQTGLDLSAARGEALGAPNAVSTAPERHRSAKRRRTPSPSLILHVEKVNDSDAPYPPTNIESASSTPGRLQRSESMTAQQILDSPPIATHAPASEDQAIGGATTGRKLTRGKAIRRSSSGLKIDSQPNSPGLAGAESPLRPLFASSGFDFPASRSPRQSVGEILTSPKIPETSEAPDEGAEGQHETLGGIKSQPDSKEISSPSPRPLKGGRRLGRRPILHDRSISEPVTNDQDTFNGATNEEASSKELTALPPHREAALRRRELPIKRPMEKRPPIEPKQQVKVSRPESVPISGPLIDFSDLNEPRPPVQVHDASLHGLASSSRDLLELLEAEEGPSELPSRVNGQNSENQTLESSIQHNAEHDTPQKRRPAPPPPVSLRIRRAQEALGGAPVSRKRSIISTADSPITPRPLHPRNTNEPSPEARAGQSAPTRRPPPPPPPVLSAQMVAEPVASGSQTGSSPSPPPPAFLHRPSFEHSHSAFSGASSISDLPELPAKFQPPWPVLSLRPTARPKGPRPPPIPPRPRTTTAWAKIPALNPPPLDLSLAEEDIESGTVRPAGGRTLSDNPPPDSWTQRSPISAGPARSRSEMDIRGVASTGGPGSTEGPRSPLEYTDLDVLVSRLEGSGREYEGYTQIVNFLGPAKSPAAPPEALATLLPGPISIDSRRTTKEGKVKLKLSLLGVRVSKCPICLTQYRANERGVLLPECGHAAHERCAERWFKEDDRCFVCREKLKADEGEV